MNRFLHTSLLIALALFVACVGTRLIVNHYEIDRLPAPVRAAVSARYPHAYQSHVVSSKHGGRMVYELHLRQDSEEHVLRIAADGQVLGESPPARPRLTAVYQSQW